jgi:hypothetical protein
LGQSSFMSSSASTTTSAASSMSKARSKVIEVDDYATAFK